MRIFFLGALCITLALSAGAYWVYERIYAMLSGASRDAVLMDMTPVELTGLYQRPYPDTVEQHLYRQDQKLRDTLLTEDLKTIVRDLYSVQSQCETTATGCLEQVRNIWPRVDGIRTISAMRTLSISGPGLDSLTGLRHMPQLLTLMASGHPGILSGAQVTNAMKALVLAEKIRYCRLMERHGDYWPETRWMLRVLPAEAIQLLLSIPALELSHPIAYRELVDKAAEKYSVPRSLIYAIMRTESGFDPQVVSKAGARGLMQVMPTTARSLQSPRRNWVPTEQDLHDPSVSIHYGVQYLAQLLRQFSNELAVIAAYNAGPGVVRRWMENGKDWDKKIPFPETRAYLDKVLAARETYRPFLGEKSLQ